MSLQILYLLSSSHFSSRRHHHRTINRLPSHLLQTLSSLIFFAAYFLRSVIRLRRSSAPSRSHLSHQRRSSSSFISPTSAFAPLSRPIDRRRHSSSNHFPLFRSPGFKICFVVFTFSFIFLFSLLLFCTSVLFLDVCIYPNKKKLSTSKSIFYFFVYLKIFQSISHVYFLKSARRRQISRSERHWSPTDLDGR